MGKRETYPARMECPKCGASGIATWEENENPVYSRGELDRQLREVPEGFRRSGDRVLCGGCGATVRG